MRQKYVYMVIGAQGFSKSHLKFAKMKKKYDFYAIKVNVVTYQRAYVQQRF